MTSIPPFGLDCKHYLTAGEDVAMSSLQTENQRGEVMCQTMKDNLVPFPKPPDSQPEPGPDFEKHHYVLEAPGRRVALDLFTCVTDLTPKPHPALNEPEAAPVRRSRRTKGKQR